MLSVLHGEVQTPILHSCVFSPFSPSSSVCALPPQNYGALDFVYGALWHCLVLYLGDFPSTPHPPPSHPTALAKVFPAPHKRELKKSLNPKIHSPLPGSPFVLPSRNRFPWLCGTEAFFVKWQKVNKQLPSIYMEKNWIEHRCSQTRFKASGLDAEVLGIVSPEGTWRAILCCSLWTTASIMAAARQTLNMLLSPFFLFKELLIDFGDRRRERTTLSCCFPHSCTHWMPNPPPQTTHNPGSWAAL